MELSGWTIFQKYHFEQYGVLALQNAWSDSDVLPSLSPQMSELIMERLTEILETPSARIDLEFEHFRLSRDLEETSEEFVKEMKERLVLALRPDMDNLYDTQNIKELIRQAHNGKDKQGGASQKPSAASLTSGNDGQAIGGKQSGQHFGQKKEGGEEDQQQPGAIDTGDLGAASHQPELVISFIGRFDVGKSSLANYLLNYFAFPVTDIRNKEKEKDVDILPSPQTGLPQMRIRSFPGYGAAGTNMQDWLQEHPGRVSPSEVVIFVLDKSMNETDFKVLRELVKRVPMENIQFVQNKFDRALAAELKSAESQKHSEVDPEKLKTELQNKKEEELNRYLTKKLEKAGLSAQFEHKHLLYTSTVNTADGEGLLELLKAIRNNPANTSSDDLWRGFIEQRMRFSFQLLKDWSTLFTERVLTGGIAAFRIAINEQNQGNKLPYISDEQAVMHLEEFKKYFKLDLEQEILALQRNELFFKLRAQAVVDHAVRQEHEKQFTDIADKVAAKLTQMGFLAKIRYVREQKQLLRKYVADEISSHQREQLETACKVYANGHHKKLAQCSRQHDWFDWFSWSDDTVIKRLKEKMNLASLAEVRQRSQQEAAPPELSLIEQEKGKLEEELGKLARKFALYYMSSFYGPYIYQQKTSVLVTSSSSTATDTVDHASMLPASGSDSPVSPNNAPVQSITLSNRMQATDIHREEASDEEQEVSDGYDHLPPYVPSGLPTEEKHIYESLNDTPASNSGAPPKPPRVTSLYTKELAEFANENIAETAEKCKALIDQIRPGVRKKLKKVIKRQLGLKLLPSSESLFREGFYRKGIIVMLLFGEGISREGQFEELADIRGGWRIAQWLEQVDDVSSLFDDFKSQTDYDQWSLDDQNHFDGFLEILQIVIAERKSLGMGVDVETIMKELLKPGMRQNQLKKHLIKSRKESMETAAETCMSLFLRLEQ